MASITFELVLGDDQETYDNLRASLPPGENNLARGLVVPAHPNNQPQTFKINNVTPGISYIIDFAGEWQAPVTPRMYIVPVTTYHLITTALPYGPVTVTVREAQNGNFQTFLLSVVNYATLFRSYAYEITQFSKLPLQQLEESIASPLSFRLATPLLKDITNLIPADLETLAALSYKLLVKNLLHVPGTLGATQEILAAFSASNPVFFKMQNINKFDSPLFRSEEVFQGYEAHVWLPNNEVERWKAFTLLLNNFPQIYTLKQITEGEVYVQQGGKLRRHLFDFDSPLANSITTGLSYLTDCFLRLFTCSVTVEAEHYLTFCQATYILDQLIAKSLSPTDADPLAVTPWSSFSLSGRFGQQFDITNTHEWYYDSPLIGVVDGMNRYFRLSKFPVSPQAVKVFVDGLLKRLYIDYRVSLSGSIISNAYRVLAMPYGPLLVQIDLGVPRPFYGPVFSTLEARGGAPLQMLLTGVEQTLADVSFIISHPPYTAVDDPQAVSIHFITPKTVNSGSPGENQYGQIPMVAGVSSYVLTFTQPTVSLDYQLLISLTVNPMPGGDPTQVQQVVHIVREHTYTGATVEFSAPLAADMTLNWWVIEDDSLTLERGTLVLLDGMSSIPLMFTNGPYFDQVVVILQLWEINPSFTDAAQYLVSAMTVGPGGTTVRFSHTISGNNYRLDYAIFPARDGDFIEFYEPPIGLVEAHYDVKWSRWINAGLSPNPDGIRTIFSLPYICSEPKSVYLALDGRLLTQGADNQYTVAGTNIVSLEGNLILNSPVVTNIFPTTNELEVGMRVVGDNIPASTVIVTIDSLSQITLSSPVPALTFVPLAELGKVRGTVATYLLLPKPFTAQGSTIITSDMVTISSTNGIIELYSLVTGPNFAPGTTVIDNSSLIEIQISSAATASSAGDFAITFSPATGDLREVVDVGTIYRWNGVEWVFFASTRSVFTAQNGGDTITFTFPPSYDQVLWAVYPVTVPGENLPSTWDQGFLNYLPENTGEYSTGWIKTESYIPVGDTVTVDGLVFEAVATAEGSVTNSSLINIGSFVTWNTLGVTLTATSDASLPRGTITNTSTISVSSTVTWQALSVTLVAVASTPASENEFKVGVSQNDDALSLMLAINSHSILSLTYAASYLAVGVTLILSNVANGFEIITASGSLTATNVEVDENFFTGGTNRDDDTAALIAAINSHSVLSQYYVATGGLGFTYIKAKELGGGFYNEILTTLGFSAKTNISGDAIPCSYNSYTTYLGEHVVSVPALDVDATANTFSQPYHRYYEGLAVKVSTATNYTFTASPVASAEVDAVYTNSGHSYIVRVTIASQASLLCFGTELPAASGVLTKVSGVGDATITFTSYVKQSNGVLPTPVATETLYYVTNVVGSTFQLALSPYGTPIDLLDSGTGYHTFTSQEVEVATSTFAFQTSILSATGTFINGSQIVTSISPTTVGLAVGMTVTGAAVQVGTLIKSVDSLNQITLNAKAITSTTAAFIAENVFIENEPVKFATKGSLPSGLVVGQTYYVVNVLQNRFQVSTTESGLPTPFTDSGVGEFAIYSVPRFAAGLDQLLDSTALANEITKHPITNAKVTTAVAGGVITVTAKDPGVYGNYLLEATGESLSVFGMTSGKDPAPTVYASPKICYYYDAPVTTLDGLSTRLWNQYGGDEFVFTYPPTLQQESYYISEVFPMDYHPLDSTVANLPCNYPKGVFTQGFGTHFNETEIVVDQPGELAIATANLPVQEAPDGDIDGINTIFTLSYPSCAGKNSLMLWIDGVFQPSDTYVYTDMIAYGQITLSSPLEVGQEIWAWYLPYGTACIDERVSALVGAIDGVNQLYDVVDSPWADTPAIVVYLEGIFVLQTQDYLVVNGNTQIQFLGALTPIAGQSLWAHFNIGSISPADNWRQSFVGITDGLADTFMIPHLLTSELPTSVDSVLVFLNGVNQGGHFAIEVDSFGNPTGNIIFTGGAPEANRRLEVAYIR